MLRTVSEINITHLSGGVDPEDNIQSKVNFDYFNTHVFIAHAKFFSILNHKIRSIQANFDKLTQMLPKRINSKC